jgi:hypothetical protein
MIIRPLCTSDDLGEAYAAAQADYSRMVQGAARPSTRTSAIISSGGDTFTVRIAFHATSPEKDVVTLLKIRSNRSVVVGGGVVAAGAVSAQAMRAQIIAITTDEWDSETVHDTPFIADFSHSSSEIGETGTLAGAGGGSGNPVVLTPTDPTVCSVLGNTITVIGYGSCGFILSQEGGPGYHPATPLVGGVHIWPQTAQATAGGGSVARGYSAAVGRISSSVTTQGRAVVKGRCAAHSRRSVTLAGGAVAKGAGAGSKHMRASLIGAVVARGSVLPRGGGRRTHSGAAVARGEAQSHFGKRAVLTGAAVAKGGVAAHKSGRLTFEGFAVTAGQVSSHATRAGAGAGRAVARGTVAGLAGNLPRPIAKAYTASLTYATASAANGPLLAFLAGTPARGGVITYALYIVATNDIAYEYVGAHFTVTIPNPTTRYFRFRYTGPTSGGTYAFRLVVIETLDGIAVRSSPVIMQVVVAAKPPLTLTASVGNLAWANGTGPYTLTLSGVVQGSPPGSSIPFAAGSTGASIPITGWCTTSGVFTLTDSSSGQSASVSVLSCGVPACSTTPAPTQGLQFTYTLGNVFRFGRGTPPYSWSFVLCNGARGSWAWYSGESNVVQLTMDFAGCYEVGGGLRVTDATGASIFKAFSAGSGPSACASVVVGGWVRIYNKSCEVSGADIYHATNQPGSVFLDSLDFGWGTYIYVNGRFRITMGWAITGALAGDPAGDSWHSFSAAMPALLNRGVADPAAAFDLYAWEGIFGSMVSGSGNSYDRWGRLHVVEVWEKL